MHDIAFVVLPRSRPRGAPNATRCTSSTGLYASAFVHAGRGNPHGIDAQLRKAGEALEAYRPYYLGVDVGHLLSHASRCHGLVADHEGLDADAWAELIPFPELVLREEFVRGDEPELER